MSSKDPADTSQPHHVDVVPAAGGSWRTYGIQDGLPSLRVEDLAEDADGYLWLATSTAGVSRFDGDVFQTFGRDQGLSGNLAYAVHVDGQQRLWVGTLDGGLCRYAGGRFLSCPADLSGPDRGVTHLYEDDDGALWVGGRGVLGWHDGEAYHDLYAECRRAVGHTADVSCWGIVRDAQGVVWFGFASVIS